MNILLVGAGGTLGKAIAAELGQRHTLITAGRSHGDVRLDLADPASIERALDGLGPLDAIVSTAGEAAFGDLLDLTPGQWELGLRSKLMGQVNLALLGAQRLKDGGSITLISGALADEPIRYGAAASMVNRAIEGFVMTAAVELPRGLRINAVSPGVFQESMPGYAPYFPGWEPIPVARAALAFARSVEGRDTGRTFKVV